MKGFSDDDSTISPVLSIRQETDISFNRVILDSTIAIRSQLPGKFEIVFILDIVTEIFLVSRVDQGVDKVQSNNKLLKGLLVHIQERITSARP